MIKKKKSKKNSKRFLIEKEYWEDYTWTDPVTGVTKTEKVKITRYKMKDPIDPFVTTFDEDGTYLGRLVLDEEEE